MSTVSIEIPEGLKARLIEAARSRGAPESQLINEALQEYLARHVQAPSQGSFTALAADVIGCAVSGPPDLSTNKKHLEGYGQS
jgi:hypothetical protein